MNGRWRSGVGCLHGRGPGCGGRDRLCWLPSRGFPGRWLDEEAPDRGYKPLHAFFVAVAEQVGAVDRAESAASGYVEIGHLAFIEPDGYEPGVAWLPQPELLYG